jgi:Domain of unknown function (DUF4326)
MLPYQKLLAKIGALTANEIVELGKSKVVQMKDVNKFDARYVKIVPGRPWSNPNKGLRSEQAFDRYKQEIMNLTAERYVDLVTELRYKTLVCACPAICHGHLLTVVANYELNDDDQLTLVRPAKEGKYKCCKEEIARLKKNLPPPPAPPPTNPTNPLFVPEGATEVTLNFDGETITVPMEWCDSDISVTFEKKEYDLCGDHKIVSHIIEHYRDELPVDVTVNDKRVKIDADKLRLAATTRDGKTTGGWYSGTVDRKLFFWIDS